MEENTTQEHKLSYTGDQVQKFIQDNQKGKFRQGIIDYFTTKTIQQITQQYKE